MNIGLYDTIAAVSTPAGSGGIGIVRISGENAVGVLEKIFVPKGAKKVRDIKSHTITYGNIVSEGKVIDEVLVSLMKAPRTYTREDVAEINCHGGITAVNSVLRAALKGGARLAEPGEFTKRAFLNGRIDLLQAEAVAEIISSKTEKAKQSAVNKLGGMLSKKIGAIREEIISAEAAIEAAIEYPEHDEEIVTMNSTKDVAVKALKEVRGLIEGAACGKIYTAGINAVILGKPNVGKSSFLNYILDEERAIVTDIPGTTRDALSETVNIKGIPVNITDTAGIRQTGDKIEKIGVDKSFKYAEEADIIFMMTDGSRGLSEEDIRLLEFIKGKKAIIIINKSDLKQITTEETLLPYAERENIITVSVKEDMGVDLIFERLKALFMLGEIDINDSACITGERNLESLRKAEKALMNVIETVDGGFPEDFLSMDLNEAYSALGEITGESLEEDVIDKIFSQFCLGK
ncbi:MAG: tRNA uridine-5-carboxymethylaminomethyl(34) synthesis GTPase MnmE [Clostridiales bacterium]|nr:tRNA uridine-5-carboxymethylaminomethyl(34) synthesis GTPase MnmE [Clostridiales bacterium]